VTGPSPDELREFAALQNNLAAMYERVFPHPLAPRTVVVVPSLSFDMGELSKISGIPHYEERMLCMLMLLRLPRTQVIYLTSQAIAPSVIDYYLHLLAGIPGGHARSRLHLFDCHDASPRALTAKVLERPRLIARIKAVMGDPADSHLTCFNATGLERTLAIRLGIPLYACDPKLFDLGTKSGSREIFRDSGIPLPEGSERLRDEGDVAEALAGLHARTQVPRAVVKLNDSFSGEGNAIFDFAGAPSGSADLERWVGDHLSHLKFEAKHETWLAYRAKLTSMGGIVEAFVDGVDKRSPSVQCRISPLGRVDVVSTHDQVLGGPSGQVFLGATFPADESYRLPIQQAGLRIGQALVKRGVIGRFGVDFVTVREGDGWKSYAIEINLRKGGTTHPFMMLQFLTNGALDKETGRFRTPVGLNRCYYATDNLRSPRYAGMSPEDLIDIAVCNNLHWHGATQTGVVFHLIGALSEFGKLGVLSIAETVDIARERYHDAVAVLDRETAG